MSDASRERRDGGGGEPGRPLVRDVRGAAPGQPFGLPVRRLVECVALAQLWCAGGIIEIALRRMPFSALADRWTAAAASPLGHGLPTGRSLLTVQRLNRLADLAAGSWRSGRECLPRALLRWWITLGTDPASDAHLVVGVRRDASQPFTAHAWLVVDGKVRGERQDPAVRFEELLRYDRRGQLVPASGPAAPARAEAGTDGTESAGGAR